MKTPQYPGPVRRRPRRAGVAQPSSSSSSGKRIKAKWQPMAQWAAEAWKLESVTLPDLEARLAAIDARQK